VASWIVDFKEDFREELSVVRPSCALLLRHPVHNQIAFNHLLTVFLSKLVFDGKVLHQIFVVLRI